MVTILNPTTRKREHLPICDVAASHMARRTLVCCLATNPTVRHLTVIGLLTMIRARVLCRYMDCIDNDGNPNRILLMDIPASQFLHANQADEAYIRVGDKSRKLTFEERIQLMYDKGERSYEDTAVYGATIDDIDLGAVAEYAKLPGQVKPSNIRNTHFSRNPKIAAFLKAYHYVKEFGEGMDRICREQEANGAQAPSFRTDEFILKITIPKVTESVTENEVNRTEKLPENGKKLPEKLPDSEIRLTEKLEKLLERARSKGDRLTENRITMLRLMIEDPYVSKSTLAEVIGISYTAVGYSYDTQEQYADHLSPIRPSG